MMVQVQLLFVFLLYHEESEGGRTSCIMHSTILRIHQKSDTVTQSSSSVTELAIKSVHTKFKFQWTFNWQ